MVASVFLIAGMTAVVTQAVLLREMLALFQGNEISIGIMLAQWLLGVALGSLWAGRNKPDAGRLSGKLGAALIMQVVLLPAMILALRHVRLILHTLPGQALGLWTLCWVATALMVPMGMLVGGQFVFGVQWAESRGEGTPGASIYLWESAGYVIGGLLFSLIGVRSLTPLAMCGLMMAWQSLALFALQRRRLSAAGIALMVAAAVVLWAAPWLARESLQAMHPGFKILATGETPYGRQVMAAKEGERTYFQNGRPWFSWPHSDVAKTERQMQLPMLFHRAPQAILLVGGDLTLAEAVLRDPVRQVDVLEPDAWRLPFLKPFLPAELEVALRDQRLAVHHMDLRVFLGQGGEAYDMVILGADYPLTLADNRLFTREVFLRLKQRMKPDAVFTLTLPGSEVHRPAALRRMTRTTVRTLQSVFQTVAVIPGEEQLILATAQAALPDIQTLIDRTTAMRQVTQFLTPDYVAHRMAALGTDLSGPETPGDDESGDVNRDLAPQGLVDALLYWQSLFAPRLTRIYGIGLKALPLVWLALPALFLFRRKPAIGVVLSSGAAGMGMHLLALWHLQMHQGTLYAWIGLLNALFMAGAAAGAYAVRRTVASGDGGPWIKRIEAAWLFSLAATGTLMAMAAPWVAAFAIAAVAGLLVGGQFPLLLRWTTVQKGRTEGRIVGGLYAADVAGGWLTAWLVGTLLIPVWGLKPTVIWLLTMKTASLWLGKRM